MTLELKKFNMRDITFKPNENKGPVVVLIGRRDTGKSFLVRDLLIICENLINVSHHEVTQLLDLNAEIILKAHQLLFVVIGMNVVV